MGTVADRRSRGFDRPSFASISPSKEGAAGSPHERSDMRDGIPACRFAHAGYGHQTHLRVLATAFARGLQIHSPQKIEVAGDPQKKRAQGRPGARCTRDLACKGRSEGAHEHTGSAEAVRPSLRNGLRLIPCSPRRDQSLFVTVIARIPPRNLTPAIGASGPHDFAVRLCHARQSQPSRPPHPTARS
jgi:hypothetical protein